MIYYSFNFTNNYLLNILNQALQFLIAVGICLLGTVQPVVSQVVFSSPTLPTDTSGVRSQADQNAFRINYFDSATRPGKKMPTTRYVIDRKTDSLLASVADSLFMELKGAEAIAGYPFNRLQFIPAIPPVRVQSWQDYRVSSRFGWRIHPIGGDARLHNGLDLSQPAGTSVYATADGLVRWVTWNGDGLGLAVCIEHPTGYQSVYGHLSAYTIRQGDVVKRGTLIGRVGSTGRSTGPHLHYAILYQGKPVDPERYCFLWMKLACTKQYQVKRLRLAKPPVPPRRVSRQYKRN